MPMATAVVPALPSENAERYVKSSVEEQSIPVIDLALVHGKDSVPQGRKLAVKQVTKAWEEWGFFQVINHGLDPLLLDKASANCQEFFQLPMVDKLKLLTDKPSVGFIHQSQQGGFVERRESLVFYGTEKDNVWPEHPSILWLILEELIHELSARAKLILGIVSESLGLPQEFLNGLHQGKGDALLTHYYPASQADYMLPVLAEHKDNSIMTIVSQQNQVDGLQVLKDGKWITVKPVKGALVVNVGDLLQVWTNGRYKSVSHRVTSNTLGRHSFAYFIMAAYDMEIAPLPQFTIDVNETPRYRAFVLADYIKLRIENKKLDSKNPKVITLEQYEI